MKIEWKLFHRRDAEHAEMIDLFSLPLTPQDRLRYQRDGGCRQRKIVMPFPPAWKPSGLEAGQGLISSDSLRVALGLSLTQPQHKPPSQMGSHSLEPGNLSSYLPLFICSKKAF